MKMADCRSDVEFKNDKHCAYDENNWRLTLTTISLRRFGAFVTSHFAVRTLTDFLAKARLLDRDVDLMCQFNCIMAAFINKSSERCVLLVFGLFR